jgi:hypothetical protein
LRCQTCALAIVTALNLGALLALASVRASAAEHSIEFTAEHLPEAAMNNRSATLPLWNAGATPVGSSQFTVQGGFARTGSAELKLDGPMVSMAVSRRLNSQWSLHAFGFLDGLRFSGTNNQRPLDTVFTRTPLVLPARALFTDLRGTYRNIGAGVAFNLHKDQGWLGERQWVIGALYQRVELRDYRATYRVLEGASSGATGFVDYSGDYSHLTPFAGLAFPRHFGSWNLTPHALLALPIPRRGFQGRIVGPGFDLSGDTSTAGNGKHFGDISMMFGLGVTYKPWGLTLDLGSFVSQALFERDAHKGIDQNWLISASKQF